MNVSRAEGKKGMSNALILLCQLLVFGLLAVSSSAKLVVGLRDTVFWGLSTELILAVAVSLFEVAIASVVLLHGTRRMIWLTVALVFIVFSLVSAYEWAQGSISCGCFGEISLAPEITLVLDVSVVVLALTLVATVGKKQHEVVNWKKILSLFLYLALCVFVASAASSRSAFLGGASIKYPFSDLKSRRVDGYPAYVESVIPLFNSTSKAIRVIGIDSGCGIHTQESQVIPFTLGGFETSEVKVVAKLPEGRKHGRIRIKIWVDDGILYLVNVDVSIRIVG